MEDEALAIAALNFLSCLPWVNAGLLFYLSLLKFVGRCKTRLLGS